jgi:hypothetical protein
VLLVYCQNIDLPNLDNRLAQSLQVLLVYCQNIEICIKNIVSQIKSRQKRFLLFYMYGGIFFISPYALRGINFPWDDSIGWSRQISWCVSFSRSGEKIFCVSYYRVAPGTCMKFMYAFFPVPRSELNFGERDLNILLARFRLNFTTFADLFHHFLQISAKIACFSHIFSGFTQNGKWYTWETSCH